MSREYDVRSQLSFFVVLFFVLFHIFAFFQNLGCAITQNPSGKNTAVSVFYITAILLVEFFLFYSQDRKLLKFICIYRAGLFVTSTAAVIQLLGGSHAVDEVWGTLYLILTPVIPMSGILYVYESSYSSHLVVLTILTLQLTAAGAAVYWACRHPKPQVEPFET